ncbi:Tn3 family transposase [Nostoc sp.]|uniref:Tn3 family transposase n=1 Tax=Nostoc sp. TaxID=1180 RepID=UPI003FA57E06
MRGEQRDFSSEKLHIFDGVNKNSPLSPLLGEKINVKLIATCWNDILRLVTSVSKGTVAASLMMRKLVSYSRQNELARFFAPIHRRCGNIALILLHRIPYRHRSAATTI